jgi:hypothetical protein
MLRGLLSALLVAWLAGPASAQRPAPGLAKPTAIWVLAQDAIDFDADVLGALAPGCTPSQGVNPGGKLVFAVACADWSAQVHPQFVRPEQMEAFRLSLLADLTVATDARLLAGGFTPDHAVARHVRATTQVINVYFARGLDADGKARDLVRAIARKGTGMIYAWNCVYGLDGTRLLWVESAPDAF